MKHLWSAIFVLSLVVNAALLLVILSGPAFSSADSPATTASLSSFSSARSLHSASTTAATLDPATWPRLRAGEDLTLLVARLRAGGFPPAVLRAIVAGLLEETYAARRKALDPDAGLRPFWKNDRPTDPKLQAALQQLAREQRRTLRDLLGPDARAGEDEDPFAVLTRRRQYGSLPPEKAAQLRDLEYRYEQSREDLFGGSGFIPPERARLADLEKQQQAEIARLLTPRELEDYNLRASSTAENLRARLDLFDPTEDEFLMLYRLRRVTDDQITALVGQSSEDATRQRASAEKTFNEQIETALGPARYEDYERATDYNYRPTAQLVTRLGLPPATTGEVWTLQRETQKRLAALTGDETLSEPDRRARLDTLHAEVTQKLTATLGPRGFAEYQRNGGNWLRALTPPITYPKN